MADPPPPNPSLGIFTFLPFFFAILEAPELEKNREKYGVGLGQTPPPLWEFFPHNPVFF